MHVSTTQHIYIHALKIIFDKIKISLNVLHLYQQQKKMYSVKFKTNQEQLKVERNDISEFIMISFCPFSAKKT